MSSWQRSLRATGIVSAIVGSLMLGPSVAVAGSGAEPAMHADLDGNPIALVDVGKYFCHDFDFPAIHCFSDPKALEARPEVRAATSTGEFVTVYEYTTYQGAYMHMSQNYTVLATIGWNDRISSFVVENSQSGNFYTDWFYGGTVYGWCCNHQLPGLGIYDNTFSSVYRF
jgi:hypothetical protein